MTRGVGSQGPHNIKTLDKQRTKPGQHNANSSNRLVARAGVYASLYKEDETWGHATATTNPTPTGKSNHPPITPNPPPTKPGSDLTPVTITDWVMTPTNLTGGQFDKKTKKNDLVLAWSGGGVSCVRLRFRSRGGRWKAQRAVHLPETMTVVWYGMMMSRRDGVAGGGSLSRSAQKCAKCQKPSASSPEGLHLRVSAVTNQREPGRSSRGWGHDPQTCCSLSSTASLRHTSTGRYVGLATDGSAAPHLTRRSTLYSHTKTTQAAVFIFEGAKKASVLGGSKKKKKKTKKNRQTKKTKKTDLFARSADSYCCISILRPGFLRIY
jgi:hypothetical protein